jgi:hypothetical protein
MSARASSLRLKAMPIIASASNTAAAKPRSLMKAIQSLLGHGFVVIPASLLSSDGS